MKNFRKDLIAHWIIHTISVLVFVLIAFVLSSLNVVPGWSLGISLIISSAVSFGFNIYWFWLKLRGDQHDH